MKIIEAMKRIKLNKEKVADLQAKIQANSANLNHETPVYKDDPKGQIDSWLQTCTDLSQENVKLLCQIQATNLATKVSIEVEPGKATEKSIAAWVWRRREYAPLDLKTWQAISDRNLKEGYMPSTIAGQPPSEVKIVRHYDPKVRDQRVGMYRSEPTLIDSALEIVNATTDLIEA
jgi:hypothetical protein